MKKQQDTAAAIPAETPTDETHGNPMQSSEPAKEELAATREAAALPAETPADETHGNPMCSPDTLPAGYEIPHSLDEVMEPLVALLKERFKDSAVEYLEIEETDEEFWIDARQIYIEVEVHPGGSHLLWRALATILVKSNSGLRRFDPTLSDDEKAYTWPIWFAIIKKTYAFNERETVHFLWASVEEGADPRDAQRQVALLVDWLRDPANLVELTPEQVALL